MQIRFVGYICIESGLGKQRQLTKINLVTRNIQIYSDMWDSFRKLLRYMQHLLQLLWFWD